MMHICRGLGEKKNWVLRLRLKVWVVGWVHPVLWKVREGF